MRKNKNINSSADQLTIIQYWDKKLIPVEISMLMNSWKFQNTDHNHKIFDRDSADEFIQKNYGSKIAQIFRSAALPAMQSDIFRIAYILNKGGIYVDAATKCEKPINSWPFYAETNCLLMRKWHRGIWNGFISSKCNSLFLSIAFDMIVDNILKKESNNVWAVTGPGVLQKVAQNCNDYELFDQSTAKYSFSLVNNLDHKKNNHWSEKQIDSSIYQ